MQAFIRRENKSLIEELQKIMMGKASPVPALISKEETPASTEDNLLIHKESMQL